MRVKKYVLVVDAREADFTELASELKEMGYEVARARDFSAALPAIASLDRLSLVVVNTASTQKDYEAFLSAVRSLHPELPVLWLTNSCDVVTTFLKPPAAAVPSDDKRGLREQASKLLRDEFYANDLVHQISDAAQEVLDEFGVNVERSEPYIKSNLTLLSDVNALIGYAGEGLSGHVILSASAADASAVYRKVTPAADQPHYDDLEDLMGEVTNRVLGRIKRIFESRGLSFKLRPPAFIRGPQARYRNKAGCPSLAIEFAEQGGMLRLEFCIDRMSSPSTESEATFMRAGEITLL